MRLTCPLCGERDRREFTYQGAALGRPEGAAWDEAWHGYLHLRENPSGWRRERWFHEAGCGAWLEVERHTTTHAIRGAWLAGEARA